MNAIIEPDVWLRFMEEEYLGNYIRNGGCSVKFAVTLDQQSAQRVTDGVLRVGERLGYVAVLISASDTKVHMMDEIFFRISEQLSWRSLSRRVIRGIAAEAGYSWPKSLSEADGTPLGEHLASANNIDPQMALLELKKMIGQRVFKERNLAKDFRVAMTHLCLAELAGGQDGAITARVVTDWLTGRNRTVGAVKPFQIFRRINRSTARYLFESMVRWVRLAGHSGIVLVLDSSRLMVPRDPNGCGLYYTKAAVLDAYELLREFVDGADHLSGYFMVVLPGAAFLEDHRAGLSAYDALKFRVFDEIRDKRLVNPMGSLVRISAGSGAWHAE